MNTIIKHREIKFILAGICLLISVGGLIFYSINTLVDKVKPVINNDIDGGPTITRFDMEKFNKLNLTGGVTTEEIP